MPSNIEQSSPVVEQNDAHDADDDVNDSDGSEFTHMLPIASHMMLWSLVSQLLLSVS